MTYACFRKCRLTGVKDRQHCMSAVSRQPNSDVQLGYLAHNQHRLSGDGSITNAEVSSILWVQEVVDMEDGQSKGRSAECSGLP